MQLFVVKIYRSIGPGDLKACFIPDRGAVLHILLQLTGKDYNDRGTRLNDII